MVHAEEFVKEFFMVHFLYCILLYSYLDPLKYDSTKHLYNTAPNADISLFYEYPHICTCFYFYSKINTYMDIDLNSILSLFRRPQEGKKLDYSQPILLRYANREYSSDFQKKVYIYNNFVKSFDFTIL